MQSAEKLPKLTIGMPVYNGERYIREAIESILAQSFTDFELIISDNASTDSTEVICKEYLSQDQRIKYIRQNKNIGAPKNFRFLLEQATGEFFIWFAHDDRWDSTYFKKAIEVLDVNHDCGLVFSNFVVRNLDTNEEKKIYAKSVVSNNRMINYLQAIAYMRSSMLYGMYRLNFLKRNQLEYFDFADIHLITSLALESKITVLNEFLYVAGTKGERIPYSLTNRRINRLPFLKKQYQLLGKYFNFPMRQVLFSMVSLYMLYNKIRLWRY